MGGKVRGQTPKVCRREEEKEDWSRQEEDPVQQEVRECCRVLPPQEGTQLQLISHRTALLFSPRPFHRCEIRIKTCCVVVGGPFYDRHFSGSVKSPALQITVDPKPNFLL